MPNLRLKVPPVAQALLCILAMWMLDRHLPLLSLEIPCRPIVAAIFVISGGWVGITGIVSFRKEKTTVNPRTPDKTGSLVSKGIYRYSRNPMYLGVLSILFGIALIFGALSAFLPIPFFIWSMTHLQIEPEEETLAVLFGKSYLDYKEKVRRWL